MKELENFWKKILEDADKERVRKGHELMNYITDYILDMKQYYKEEYGDNWQEAMEQDSIWQIREDKFSQLLREYYELTIL